MAISEKRIDRGFPKGRRAGVKAAYLFEFAPGAIKEGISKEILIGDALQNIGRNCYNKYIFFVSTGGKNPL